jgi:hypothetical protein
VGYSFVDYELAYEHLKAVKGQVTDFIAKHGAASEDNHIVEECPWWLFFDSSVYSRCCGISYVTVSPGGSGACDGDALGVQMYE